MVVVEVAIFALKTLLAYLFFERFVKPCYIQWKYSRRGVPFWSSVPKPFIGDTLEFAKRVGVSPDRPHFFDLVKDRFGEEIPPCFGMQWAHGTEIILTDADYMKDVYTTYDKFFTK